MSLAHPLFFFSRKGAFFILVLSGLVLLLLAVLSMLVPVAHAAQVTVAWDRESDPDVAGYKIYYGIHTGQYTASANAGTAASLVISGLQEGVPYYFAAVAYDITGLESDHSNEVSYTSPVVPSCSFSISPISQLFSASGGTGTVNVATPSTCTWSVSKSASWITITAGSSGTGSGNVTYTVASNSGSGSRSAVLTIAGQTITVNQSGQASPAMFNSHDLSADGKPDLIWQNQATGDIAAWLMNGTAMTSSTLLTPSSVADLNWQIVCIADFNADGKPDILWQHQTTGQLNVWLMNGTTMTSSTLLTPSSVADLNWKIVGCADINADGKPDILWQHQTTGWIGAWLMNGTAMTSSTLLTPSSVADLNWKIVGVADFNGDGHPDLVWQHQTTGWIGAWLMNGTAMTSSTLLTPSSVVDLNWKIVGVADFNSDGKPDLIWQHQTTGWIGVWLMNGTAVTSSTLLTPSFVTDLNWKIVGR